MSAETKTQGPRVGFIGLGTMGTHMAANLQKAGFRLTVYDLRRAAAESHLAAGAAWANSPQEVAAASEVVFTSLPSPREPVRQPERLQRALAADPTVATEYRKT